MSGTPAASPPAPEPAPPEFPSSSLRSLRSLPASFDLSDDHDSDHGSPTILAAPSGLRALSASDDAALPSGTPARARRALPRPVADLSRVRSSQPKESPVVVRQYSLETRLGSGAFGTVWKGFNLKTGEAVAIKKISTVGRLSTTPEDRDDALRQARDEIRIMKPLAHDHIVKYFDAFEQRDPTEQHESLFIVLEYCEIGSLNRWFKQPGLDNRERLVAKFMGQVLDGLSYLHHQGVIHRDIKGDNILLVKNARIKLADFGIATAVAAVQGDKVQGTPYWMAPEALMSKPTTKSDIWSVGCVVVELMQHGQHPWHLLTDVNASYRALNGQHPAFPPDLTELGRDFLRVCFQTDQALRHDADTLGRHRWILHSKDGQPRGFYDDSASVSHSEASPAAAPHTELEAGDWDDGDEFGLDASDLARLDHPKTFNPNVVVVSETEARHRPSVGSISAAAASRGAPNKRQVSNEEPWDQGLDLDTKRLSLRPLGEGEEPASDPLSDSGEGSDEDVDDLERRLLEDEEDAEEMEAWSRAREEAERRREEVVQLVEEVNQYGSLEALERSLSRLREIFMEDARQKHAFFSAQGAFSLLELMENEVLPLAVLQVLNVLASNDVDAQEILCVIGTIPAIKPFTEPHCDYALRLEAGRFFTTMCLSKGTQSRFSSARAGFFAPRTILSCGGLKAIADMLAENYADEGKELVWFGAACVHSVLGLPVSIAPTAASEADWHVSKGRKSTFCNLLVRQAVLDPLSIAMQNVASDGSFGEARTARKHIFKTLNILSRSDTQVRVQLARGTVPRRLLRVIDSEHLASEPDLLYTALQCVKNLSMTPECADGLRKKGNAVEILTHLLIRHLSDEDHRAADEIITALYYLCRLPPLGRVMTDAPLEEAAEAGVVPVLLSMANSLSSRKSVVKPFAVSMLCDMAQAGNATRQKLWPRALEQYLDMVSTDYWAHQQTDISLTKGEAQPPDYHSQAQALESICTWLQADFARIEHVLLKAANLERLAQYLQSAVDAAFTGASSDLLTPFLRLTRLAPKVVAALVGYESVVRCIQDGLQEGKMFLHKRKNDTRLNLLRLVRAIVDAHPDGRLVLHKADLISTLRSLERSTDESAVLVKGLAREILRAHSPDSPLTVQEFETDRIPHTHSRQASSDQALGEHIRPRVTSQTRYATHSVSSRGILPSSLGSRRPSHLPSSLNIPERSRRKEEVILPSPLSPVSPLSPTRQAIPSPLAAAHPLPSPCVAPSPLTRETERLRSQLPPSHSSPSLSQGMPGRRVLRTLPVQPGTHTRTRHGASADLTSQRAEAMSFGSAVAPQHFRGQSGEFPSSPHDGEAGEPNIPTRRTSTRTPASRTRTSLPTPTSSSRRGSLTNCGPSHRTRVGSPTYRQERQEGTGGTQSRRNVSVSASIRGARPDIQASVHTGTSPSRRGSSPAFSEGSKPSSPAPPTSPPEFPISRRPILASSRLFSSHVSGLPRMPSHSALTRPGQRRTASVPKREPET